MKFSTREDIEAPIDYVFPVLSDFGAFERRALRHGANVLRVGGGPVESGAEWDIAFKFRGRDRQFRATITDFDAPHGYAIEAVSEGMFVTTTVDLVALSRGRTRVAVAFDLRAKTLTTRMLLQSMKLAKTKLNKRYKARVLEFCEDIEDGYRKLGR